MALLVTAQAQAAPARDTIPQKAPIPRWEAATLPNMTLGPACRRETGAFDDSFKLMVQRGVQLTYASPITVSGWRSPQAACRRFNASGIFNLRNFQWHNAHEIQQSFSRLEFQTTFSYAWRYDRRYLLQRFEPGLVLFGTLQKLPHIRLFCDFDLASVWKLRLEDTFDTANTLKVAMQDWVDFRATMKYTF